jgi:hypothetical protein
VLTRFAFCVQQGVNCCAEIQALLECPPVGPCRGVEANCGDLAEAFADTPVLPDYPDGLADYVCGAFPDDENPRDSLIVGLLAFAIALPVTRTCPRYEYYGPPACADTSALFITLLCSLLADVL